MNGKYDPSQKELLISIRDNELSTMLSNVPTAVTEILARKISNELFPKLIEDKKFLEELKVLVINRTTSITSYLFESKVREALNLPDEDDE